MRMCADHYRLVYLKILSQPMAMMKLTNCVLVHKVPGGAQRIHVVQSHNLHGNKNTTYTVYFIYQQINLHYQQ